ncbi:type III secretion system needle length determinant [Aeromonas veronii]|nr:type III secretion system needle length determinant [Aeromonas veronii]UZE60951.1 type III secretion system needle length determinant [Aeromonas veronii]
MNRILPIQGTVTVRGDTQMAEASRSQQQRFEQAMRLESDQKAPDKHRANGQSKTQEPRPQQLLQTQQQKKQAADTVQQSDIAASHSQPKHLQTQQLITRKAPSLSGSALPGVAARDQREVERKKSQQTRDARDQDPEVGASAVGLPASERGFAAPLSMVNAQAQQPPLEDSGLPVPEREFAAPLSMVNAQAPRPEKETYGSQQHGMQTTTLTSGTELPQGAIQTAPQQGVASLAEESELAELLASGTAATEVTDEIPEASGQPIPPQVKTPGDLQLARLAPAENNRELGQLLEWLAVDIYQELGRPERPPLLRLTLPQLGDLSIRIAHHHGELQIEILATSEGQLLLNQGRSDLVDRLQRLYPGERVALDLFGQPDSEQGSRHKRSIYEEWDADA